MKLDLGCGKSKKEGFTGVDSIEFPGVDVVHDLTTPWPWKDETVDEIHCSHFLEHLRGDQRYFFANELFRVLKKGGRATIITPDWGSVRAYGDPTHQWPPVTAMTFTYWNKAWRDGNAPHTDAANLTGGFACDFDAAAGYSVAPSLAGRNQEFVQFATTHYIEARIDLMATLTKR